MGGWRLRLEIVRGLFKELNGAHGFLLSTDRAPKALRFLGRGCMASLTKFRGWSYARYFSSPRVHV